MQKAILNFTLALLSIFTFGCGTTRPLHSKVKPHEIKTLDLLILPSNISSISKNNMPEFNQALSDSFQVAFTSKISNYIPTELRQEELPISDLAVKQSINNELFNLISFVEKKRNIKNIQVSHKLIEYFSSIKSEYVLVGFSSGFTREKGNYGKQVAKGLGVGLLTLGMVVPVPYKANLTNIIFILDVKNSNIAFYRRATGEIEPLKEVNIERRIKFILDSYFYGDLVGH
jgi:hypothetical protein